MSDPDLRLHVFLARAGKGSRRAMEAAIAAGRVRVNGEPVTRLGAKIDPSSDLVALDGQRVDPAVEARVYVALNKPRGVLTTASDDRGRKTVLDLLPQSVLRHRLYPVGRLDRDSEGLVLLTNDGKLTNRITHPSYDHEREYAVDIAEAPDPAVLEELRSGVRLDGVLTRPAHFEVLSTRNGVTTLRVVLREGKNRQIRRMLTARGHDVVRLVRTRLGPIRLGSLKPGDWRYLDSGEVSALEELK